MMILILMIFSIFLIIVSKIMRYKAEKARETYKIIGGDLIYSDLDASAKPLFSKKYSLTGKPDYVIKSGNQYIPIELKIGKYNTPLRGHILQLAAYCQMVEESFKTFVPYGVIVYSNGSKFKIPFDPRIRFELENIIKEIRECIKKGNVNFGIRDVFKCRECSMRKYCDVRY